MKRISFLVLLGVLMVLGSAAPASAQILGGASARGKAITMAVANEGLTAIADPAAPASVCATGTHCIVFTWTESTTAPAGCTMGVNLYQGTAAGAENMTTPLNSSPITAGTYTETVTLTSTPQTFYIVAQAVETCSGISQASANSNEVSSTFPGIPAAPSLSVSASN